MIKRALQTGLALAALLLATVVGATPASADGTISLWNDTHQIRYGYGHFASVGEIFTACDTYTDNKGISVDWYVVSNPSNNGEAYDASGNDGQCATSNGSVTEGKTIAYRVCRRDNGAYVFCSSYFRDTA